VVTVSPDQHLLVAANEAKEPVEVVLAKGKNLLRFTRHEPVRGVTLKDFTLMRVK